MAVESLTTIAGRVNVSLPLLRDSAWRMMQYVDESIWYSLVGREDMPWDRQIYWNGYVIFGNSHDRTLSHSEHPTDARYWDAKPDPMGWLADWLDELSQWPRRYED